jgi:hypothetical protein
MSLILHRGFAPLGAFNLSGVGSFRAGNSRNRT